MIPPQLFITGTDTDVGKTVVSTLLARAFNARYWKPVQTGSEESRDSVFVAKWAKESPIEKEAFVLRDPLSPHLAAAHENTSITVAEILSIGTRTGILSRLDAGANTATFKSLVIEGAGGVMVPLNASETMRDLMVALQAPVVVVSRTRLGTINHTLLTVQSLQAAKIPIFGIFFVGPENEETIQSIRERAKVPILGTIPWVSTFTESWMDQMVIKVRMQIHDSNN